MSVALIGHRTLTQGPPLMADIPVLSAADQAKADKAKADKTKPDAKADEKAKEKKPAAEGAAAAPGRKKLFIMIAIGVVVLGGAGAGGWLMFAGKHDDTAKTAASKGKPNTKASKAEKEKEEPAATGPSIYVALDPPFVVNFESEQLVRFLQVTAQVSTRDPETAELLKANDPMIRNDMLLLLGNQTYATVSTREGKEKLRAGALDTVRNVVKTAGGKPKNVEAVFFTSFVMQ